MRLLPGSQHMHPIHHRLKCSSERNSYCCLEPKHSLPLRYRAYRNRCDRSAIPQLRVFKFLPRSVQKLYQLAEQ